MNVYDVGDLVQVRAAFSVGSIPTDPTEVTVTVRVPDGTASVLVYGVTPDPALVREATGAYRLDYTPTLAGTYWYSFVGTGAAQETAEGAFAVRPSRTSAVLPDLCSPADVQQLIQVPIDASNDAVLAAIAVASRVIRNHTGQLLSYVADDTVVLSAATGGVLLATSGSGDRGSSWGGGSALYAAGAVSLWLPELPVVDVTAVSVGGDALVAGDWGFEAETGRLVRLWSAYAYGGRWPAGYRNVSVTYSHGYAVIPADLADVCARVAARRYLGGLRSALVGPHARESDFAAVYQGESLTEMAGAYGPTSAPILTGHERDVLADYRVIPVGY